jgi:methionyl-tRNA formyltransferase
MIEKAEAAIDFNRPAKEVRNLIMGMNPAPGAFIDCGEYRLKLHEAYEAGAAKGTPGTVAGISSEGITVVCGDGNSIQIKTIQKQGKNRTDAYSYACGAKLAIGEYLK